MRRFLWIPVLVAGLFAGWWLNTSQQPVAAQTDVTRALLVAQTATGATTTGHQFITNLDATTAQTLTVPAGTRTVEIWAEDSIRWRSDGTAPTATVGFLVSATDWYETDVSIAGIKVIATAGTSQKVGLHYSR